MRSGPMLFGMKTLAPPAHKLERARWRPALLILASCAGLVLLAMSPHANAAAFDTGTDLDVNWNNTIRLSAAYQFGKTTLGYSGYCPVAAHQVPNEPHEHEECGYDTGFLSGRVDWTSELDLEYRGYGLLVSSAAWYDEANRSGGYDHSDSSELGGRDIELFDAFVHGATAIDSDQTLSFRIGRQDLIWGESRFFTQDAIAGGQAPVDTYRGQATSGYQSKNAVLPVGQASFRWQGLGEVSIEGYYQFEWRRSRIDPRDAYSGTTDILGTQGNNLISVARPIFYVDSYVRLPDRQPAGTGQFGLAAKWQHDDFDFGLYGLRFDAKSPQIYIYGRNPGSNDFTQGGYRLEYPEDIELYGVSVSGPLGDANFGAELSARRNMPLVNGSVFIPSAFVATADNDRHPHYPLGDTLHAQFSWNDVLSPSSLLPDGAVWTGEIAADHLIQTTANADQLTPGRTRTAAAFRTVFEPQFLQVLPRIDLSVPIGVGYNFLGLSEVDPAMNRGTGDMTVGLTVTLDQVWKGSLSLTHYFGKSKYAPAPFGSNTSQRALADWDFIAVTVERSF
jgi:Protein of unknown function (DUF1302)